MEESTLQWHPGFQAAIQIELMDDSDALQFEKEYNLTENPLRVDTLIIKVKPGRRIRKSIGTIFRQYNIVEYKSPNDYISINDFYKVMGYASIFQSNTEKVMEIPPEEVTVTFAANRYPAKLMRYLKRTYGAVMDLLIRANQKRYEEEKQMCDAIRELFADEYVELVQKLEKQEEQLSELTKQLKSSDFQEEVQRERTNGLKAVIETCKEFGISYEDTVAKVMEKFALTREAAEEEMKAYWVK